MDSERIQILAVLGCLRHIMWGIMAKSQFRWLFPWEGTVLDCFLSHFFLIFDTISEQSPHTPSVLDIFYITRRLRKVDQGHSHTEADLGLYLLTESALSVCRDSCPTFMELVLFCSSQSLLMCEACLLLRYGECC